MYIWNYLSKDLGLPQFGCDRERERERARQGERAKREKRRKRQKWHGFDIS
jgi:hypothetical protein